MNILEMKGIEKSFGGIKVLKNMDFSVRAGEVHAICGENGAGKSTLMKILSGIYKRDKGEIIFKGKEITPHETVTDIQKLGISMIFQELNLLDELTVAQNIFLTRERTKTGLIDEKQMIKLANDLLQDLIQIDACTKVRELSIAQKQIVEIAKAISFKAELIIMDEPTAVLTIKEVEMLFGLIRKLKERGLSIIYISHRLPEIVDICDRITVLRDGELAGTSDVCILCQRDIANMMVGRELEAPHVEPYDACGREPVFRAEHVSIAGFVDDVSFSMLPGEILGLYGLVGAGRSELAEGLFGIRQLKRGDVFINNRKVSIRNPMDAISHKMAFVTEDRRGSGLFAYRSILENITTISNVINKSRMLNRKLEKAIATQMKNTFRIKYDDENMEVINLSGGNQQKIVFGKWAAGDADIFFLDEPTRGVDVGARKEIYNHIVEMANIGKAILVISSDITELLETSHRIVVMHQGRMTGELLHKDATEERIIAFATGIETGVN
jgi:ABC-type sugar transport system ATPase subunit